MSCAAAEPHAGGGGSGSTCGPPCSQSSAIARDTDEMNRASDSCTFSLQVSGESYASASTAVPTVELLSRQCTEAETMAQKVLEDELGEAVRAACAECSFCVSVSDPRLPDCPLIAVSEGFEVITGFRREEILGVNCRFLNQGCDLDPATLADLRQACRTGQPFTAVLTNRRKNGQLFLNLLDLRGLIVGRTQSGEDVWFLVGIQADVSCIAEDDMPEGLLPELKQVASAIRKRITSDLGVPTWTGAQAMAAGADERTGGEALPRGSQDSEDVRWQEGPQLGKPPGRRAPTPEPTEEHRGGLCALLGEPRPCSLPGGLVLFFSVLAAALILQRLRRTAAHAS